MPRIFVRRCTTARPLPPWSLLGESVTEDMRGCLQSSGLLGRHAMSDRETIIEAMSWCEDFDTGRWGREKAEALLAAHDEAIRADQAERIAAAIEAEFEEWRTCSVEPITEFPLNSAQWWVKRAYEKAARIARSTDTKAGGE